MKGNSISKCIFLKLNHNFFYFSISNDNQLPTNNTIANDTLMPTDDTIANDTLMPTNDTIANDTLMP